MSLANTRRGGGSSRTVRNRSKKASQRRNRGGYVKFNKFTESDTIPKIVPYGKGTTNPTAEQFFTEVFDHMQSNTSNTTERTEIISELNRIGRKKSSQHATFRLYNKCANYAYNQMNSRSVKQLAEQVRNSYASTQNPHHHNPELSLQLIPSKKRIYGANTGTTHSPVRQTSDKFKKDFKLDTLKSSPNLHLPKKLSSNPSSIVPVSNLIKKKKTKKKKQTKKEARAAFLTKLQTL